MAVVYVNSKIVYLRTKIYYLAMVSLVLAFGKCHGKSWGVNLTRPEKFESLLGLLVRQWCPMQVFS